jgi:hypothetical protein
MSVHKRRRLNPIGQKPVENKTGKKWWAMKLMKEKRNKPMKTKKKKTLTKRRKARKLKPKSVAAPVFNKGDMVLVVDERVGQTSYGKKAKVVSVTSTIAFLNFSPDGGSMSVPLNCLKANKFEPSKALKSITILKNMQKLNILKDMNCQGDAGDQVATSDQSGKQLLHQSLVAGWSLMKMLMPGCKPGKLEEYIYINIYIYIYTYVCICTCIHVYTYTYIYIYIYMCTLVHICIIIHIWMHVYIYTMYMYIDMCTPTYLSIYVHMYTYTYVYT